VQCASYWSVSWHLYILLCAHCSCWTWQTTAMRNDIFWSHNIIVFCAWISHDWVLVWNNCDIVFVDLEIMFLHLISSCHVLEMFVNCQGIVCMSDNRPNNNAGYFAILTVFTARRNARIASYSNSVRPSQADIVSKRLHVAWCSLHCQIAKCV